jgi:peptidoglycan-associated lipoprotein
MPVQAPIEVLRADFSAQSGGTIVYFAPGSAQLTQQATTMLANQAMWLRQHPEVLVRIEGHGDPTDTRDHALALGAERAAEARDYLILLGLPAPQISAMTWGKERPGPPSAVTTIDLGGAPLVPAAG